MAIMAYSSAQCQFDLSRLLVAISTFAYAFWRRRKLLSLLRQRRSLYVRVKKLDRTLEDDHYFSELHSAVTASDAGVFLQLLKSIAVEPSSVASLPHTAAAPEISSWLEEVRNSVNSLPVVRRTLRGEPIF